MKKLLLILIIVLTLTGCSIGYDNQKSSKESDNMSSIKVIINNEDYILNLEDNETVKEFVKLLPIEYTMNELNGNEKYVYLDASFPTDSYNPKQINKGDVFLFGNDCLVIFYESFTSNYSYTKIGHIDNLPDLGSDSIKVKFEINVD